MEGPSSQGHAARLVISSCTITGAKDLCSLYQSLEFCVPLAISRKACENQLGGDICLGFIVPFPECKNP